MSGRKRGPHTDYRGHGRRFFVSVSPYAAFVIQQLATLEKKSMSAVLRAAVNEYVEQNKDRVDHGTVSAQ